MIFKAHIRAALTNKGVHGTDMPIICREMQRRQTCDYAGSLGLVLRLGCSLFATQCIRKRPLLMQPM